MENEAVESLMAMLARVEGIPLDSVRAGLDIRWRTSAEYLNALEPSVAVNTGFLVGNSAVRRLLLGDDWQRTVTEQEVARGITPAPTSPR